MKFVLYGLPCAGKDYLLERMPFIEHIKGSEWLNAQCGGKFREMPEDKQNALRIKFIEYVKEMDFRNIIVDGHYAFPEGDGFRKAFTESDGDCYDVFVYLDTPVETIFNRIQDSEKNTIYSKLTQSDLQVWRDYEVDALFHEALVRGKEFILLDYDLDNIITFMKGMADGTIRTAPQVSRANADRVIEATGGKRRIILSDGDKTLTITDLTKSVPVPEELKVHGVFDGDRYTTYQFWRARQTHASLDDLDERYEQALSNVEFDEPILNDLSKIDGWKVIVTAGLEGLWQKAAELTGVMDMAVGSDPKGYSNMSQLGKAYFCRYLREAGFEVIALGDNMVDYYMLMEADRGYIIAHAKRNATLQSTVLSGTKLRQPSSNQTKFEGVEEVNSIHEDIE